MDRASRAALLLPGSFSNKVPKGSKSAALSVQFFTSGTNFGHGALKMPDSRGCRLRWGYPGRDAELTLPAQCVSPVGRMQQPRGPTIPYSKFRLSSTFWPPRVHLWRLQRCRQQAGIPHIPLGCVWTCWSQISPVPISQEFSSPLLSPGMTCTFWGGAYTKFKGHPTATIHGNSPALGQPPSDGFPS